MAFFVTAVVAAFAEGASVAVIATAVSEVGMALSVVGAVTGNATLEKVGGVMGLAGGVAGLADGTFGAAAGAATDATGATGDPMATAVSSPAIDSSAAMPSDALGAGSSTDAAASSVPDLSGSAVQSPIDGMGVNSITPAQSPANTGLGSAGTPSAALPGAPAPIDGSLAGSPSYQSVGTSQTDYNSIANQPATPVATTTTPIAAQPPVTVSTTPSVAPGATGTFYSPAAGNSVAQLNQQTGAAIGGENPALTNPGTLVAGTPDPTTSNDILDTGSAQGGSSYGTGAGINGAAAAPGGATNGILNWVNNNPHTANMLGQLGAGMASGAGKAYEANRQYQLGLGQLTINQQRQANANSQVASGGIINTARYKANTGS